MKISPAVSIGIIGAGMSGMLMAIKLLRAGKTNFTVFEKAEKVGGVWRDNRYPGIACDAASVTYCYDFEHNPDWSHRFSDGAQIQEYFETIAQKYHLDQYIEFNTEVVSAKFDEDAWQVTTNNGGQYQFNIFIDATGPLNEKAYPDIQGLDDFAGEVFHTADWNEVYDLSDKRVGVIGSGASGVQITHPIAQQAKQLTAFIRTPQWIFPTYNARYSTFFRYLKRKIPILNKLERTFYNVLGEQLGRAALYKGLRRAFIQKVCELNLNRIKSPILREKLRPNHQAMCKRMVVSANYYQALQQDNVFTERSKIMEVTANGIRTEDGNFHELDLIVLATGFHPNAWGVKNITGLDGVSLETIWQDEKSRNYQSIAIPGLPNFFVLIGSHSPITNLSLIDVADIGIEYILQCIEKIEQGDIKTMTPKKDAAIRFYESLAAGFDGTIWLSGCASWYLEGTTLPQTWPWPPSTYKKALAKPNLADYNITYF